MFTSSPVTAKAVASIPPALSIRLIAAAGLFFGFLFAAAKAQAQVAIEIDLSKQCAYVIHDDVIVYTSPISSGRSSHPTPPGNFVVTEKDIDHRSSLYGKIVNSSGRVLDRDADCDTPVPKGCSFVRAPMKHFLRFNGAVGMHAGRLPGYAASHGCVRLPSDKAALFFNIAELGTPVRVFGKAPYRAGGSSSTRTSAKPKTATPVPTPPPKVPWYKRIFRNPNAT